VSDYIVIWKIPDIRVRNIMFLAKILVVHDLQV